MSRLWVVAWVWAASLSAPADTIRLKVGTTLRGEIIGETQTDITIREKGAAGSMTVRKADVTKVTRDKAAPASGGVSGASAAAGAGGAKRRAAHDDTRWLSEDEAVLSDSDSKPVREREDDFRARVESLKRAGDAAGLQALGQEIRAAAEAVPGDDGDRIDGQGRDAILEGVELEVRDLLKSGKPVMEERALAFARTYADIDVEGDAHNTRGMAYWYVQAALRSPDPYRYDLELRDREGWGTLADVRLGQKDRWRVAEPRTVTVGHTLPSYRHLRGGFETADEEPPRPFPQEQRAWQRCNDRPAYTGYLVPRNNPTLSDWCELLWDVQTGSWEKTTTLERLRAEEWNRLMQVSGTRTEIENARHALTRARAACRNGLHWIDNCRHRMEHGDERTKAFEAKRVEETRSKIAASREEGRAALQRHQDALRTRAQLIEAWEKHRERLMALTAEEKKALERNYTFYVPLQE